MGGFITLINSVMSFLINVLQDISAIKIDKSMPNSAISFRIFSEALDAILEVSDFGLVVSVFDLEADDLGPVVDDLGLVVSNLDIFVRHPILQPLNLGIFVRHPILQPLDFGLVVHHQILHPLQHIIHFVFLLQDFPAFLIPIGHPLSSRSAPCAFHGSPQRFLSNGVDVFAWLYLDVIICDNVITIGL